MLLSASAKILSLRLQGKLFYQRGQPWDDPDKKWRKSKSGKARGGEVQQRTWGSLVASKAAPAPFFARQYRLEGACESRPSFEVADADVVCVSDFVFSIFVL